MLYRSNGFSYEVASIIADHSENPMVTVLLATSV